MSQNAIPALRALALLSEANSSNQQAVNANHSLKVSHTKTAVSFTVLATTQSHLILQDNANRQRVNVPTQALQSTSAISKGDTLILVSANEKSLNFRLLPATTQTPADGKANNPTQGVLPTSFNKILAESWPDLGLSALNKAPVVVANHLQLDASHPSILALAKSLTQSAVHKGQPHISLPLSAQFKEIIHPNTPQAKALLTLNTQQYGLKSSNLLLPLSQGFLSKLGNTALNPNTHIQVTLSPSNKNAAIREIVINEGQKNVRFSAQQLSLTNKINPDIQQAAPAISERLLFSAKGANNPVYVQTLNQVLSSLPKDFALQVKNTLSSSAISDARVLITGDANKHKSSAKIHVFAVDKPQTVKIAASDFNAEQLSTHIRTELKSAGQENASINKKLYGANPLLSQSTAQHGQLLAALEKTLTKDQLTSLGPKLQQALTHTLTHTEVKAQALTASNEVLNNILKTASADTQSLLKPLQTQLRVLMGDLDLQTVGNEKTNINATLDKQTAPSKGEQTRVKLAELALPDMLRSLMSSQAVTQLTQPPSPSSQNSFIEGLVNLLKLSLAASLANFSQAAASSKPQQMTYLQSMLSSFVSNMTQQSEPKQTRTAANRLLQDISQADPRGALISEIGKLLSKHNTQKLRSAEATLQGQDTFYYALPNILNKNGKDIEILIKRERENTHDKKQGERHTTWKLDMKLDIGKQGTVLAKTSMRDSALDLHLYASNEALKHRVLACMPLLHERLSSLGIEVNSQACDIGKLDTPLLKTKLNVMHTYA